MKWLPIAFFLLLPACAKQEQQDPTPDNTSAAVPPRGNDGAAQLASLTGLYESGEGPARNQLCIVDGKGSARFGLVVWGGNMHSCSGIGTAARDGNRLKLSMTGDETCTIGASISGRRISLPAEVPAGCAYYCGARARLGGASFGQVGATKADALKAKDLVGEPLCAGM